MTLEEVQKASDDGTLEVFISYEWVSAKFVKRGQINCTVEVSIQQPNGEPITIIRALTSCRLKP